MFGATISNMLRRPLWVLPFVSTVWVFVTGIVSQPSLESAPAELIREEQQVVVNGITETWQLVWKTPPSPFCGAEDPSMAISCPCSGFAFGEIGEMELVRLADGRDVGRMDLTPLFSEVIAGQRGAMIPRWQFKDSDIETLESANFESAVRSRPAVKIMNFADYNHDGAATEFFLQTDVAPCGKRLGVIVGIATGNPHLHAFGTARRPNSPLILQKTVWDALAKSAKPSRITDWPCGDHGSEIESEIEIRATVRGIQGTRREYQCTETGRGRLIRQQEL